MINMKAVYKCRLCGERFHNGAETGPDVAERCMIEMNVGIVGTVAMAPNKTDTHRCGGPFTGSLGLADFQGWEEEKALSAEKSALYEMTVNRLRRMGHIDHTAQIVALAEEIEYYRKRINGLLSYYGEAKP